MHSACYPGLPPVASRAQDLSIGIRLCFAKVCREHESVQRVLDQIAKCVCALLVAYQP